MKRCTKCLTSRPAEDYPRDKYKKSGRAPRCKFCNRQKSIAYGKANPERKMWHAARTRARRQIVPFNISPSDIVIPTHCPVLGIPLYRDRKRDHSPQLDRFVSSRGYVRGNIAVISGRANRIKTNATAEEIHAVARWIGDRQ